MTTSHHEHPPLRGDRPPPDAERIAAELAALGEAPADDDELAFVSASALGRQLELPPDPDVRTVATLVELSAWEPPPQGLSELELHRAWRAITPRMSPPATVVDPEGPAANGVPGWRGMVAGLALVAGVVMLPRFDAPPAPTEEQRAATQSVGEVAREVLDTLPGEQDATRARHLAEGYAERLHAARGERR